MSTKTLQEKLDTAHRQAELMLRAGYPHTARAWRELAQQYADELARRGETQ